METAQRTSKSLWIIVLTIALAASLLGFSLSYQEEQTRFSEMASVAQSHLTYALQLKDDMALIDWSKGLEKLPSVLAFQVRSGSKIVAAGGNQQMCPSISTDGLSFDFPYRWIIHSTLSQASAAPVDITLVFQDFRGPLFWGICLFSTCFLTGWILIRSRVAQKSLPSAHTPTTPEIKNPEVVKPTLSVDVKSFTLALNNDYVICQATPSAAKALDRQVSDLVGSHFLDLAPDPSIMKAIGEAKEIKLLKPFPSHPHLSAFIYPASEGTILVLETVEESKNR